jgi:hypothetical protein
MILSGLLDAFCSAAKPVQRQIVSVRAGPEPDFRDKGMQRVNDDGPRGREAAVSLISRRIA